MKRLLALICLLGAGLVPGFAQGEDALPFTAIQKNPVTLGMGGAGFASVDSPAWSSFSNTAMVPFSPVKFDAALSYARWAPDAAKTDNFAAGVSFRPIERLGVSIGYAYNKAPEFKDLEGSFTPYDMHAAVGVGFKVGERVALGLSGAWAQSTIDDESYSALSGSASIFVRAAPWLDLAAGIYTIGEKVTGITGKDFSQPTVARLGGTCKASIWESSSLKGNLDVEYYFSDEWASALGVQYDYKEMVFVRGGYRFASEDCVIPSFLSFGAGFRWAGLSFDISYLTASDTLGNSVMLGLGYRF